MIIYTNILLLCITILPKINLIKVGGSSTGIRIEDILILIYIMLEIMSRFKNGKKINCKKLNKIKKIFSVYIMICICSTFFGTIKGWINPLVGGLYLIRKIEYFCMIYIGYNYMKKIKDLYKILPKINYIIYIHFCLSILQMIRINGII